MNPQLLWMIRTTNKLTQEAMANRIGVSQSLLTKIERGERAITKKTESKILAVFNDETKIQKLRELAGDGSKQNERTKGVE
jgi:transcriptional regulator with XRE-family HTH domain